MQVNVAESVRDLKVVSDKSAAAVKTHRSAVDNFILTWNHGFSYEPFN